MDDILAHVAHRLLVRPPERLGVSLLPSRAFEAVVGPRKGEWAVAVARPGRGDILVNLGRLDLRNNLVTTLTHETVHLVLGAVEARAGRPLPRWFHEGVAQVVCGRLFAGTRDEFLVACRAGNLYALDELTDSFPDTGSGVRVAYAQSEDFVAHLEGRVPDAAGAILARFADGLSFPDALRRVMGEDLGAVEAAWRKEKASGSPFLVAWLMNNPGALWILIFTLGAVLVFAGYVRVRARRRQLMKKWEEEDAMWGEED
jgi:hypothetical protein